MLNLLAWKVYTFHAKYKGGVFMSTQEIIITNVKTAPHKKVSLNQMFDPDNEHKQSFEFENCVISSPFIGNKCNVTAYSVPPKKSNYPYHYHSGVEEVFFIISGTGLLETSKGETAVSEGDVIVIPSGKNGAHRLTNSSDDMPLVYLDVDTSAGQDIVFYPHTNKLMAVADGFRKWYKIDSDVNYLDGE